MKTYVKTIKLVAAISGWLALILCHPATVADGAAMNKTQAPKTTKIPVGKQSVENQDIERPVSGMSKEKVEQRYGEPQHMANAIGEPPISSWEYADYTVYFEYDRVIHTVLK